MQNFFSFPPRRLPVFRIATSSGSYITKRKPASQERRAEEPAPESRRTPALRQEYQQEKQGKSPTKHLYFREYKK